MNLLKFSYNWNNKLDNHAFTTLRLANDIHKVGTKWVVEHKKQYRPCHALIVDKKSILLKDINEWMARLDTGYSREECQDVIRKMYKNRGINWDYQRLDFMLLVYTKDAVMVQPELFNA